MKFSICVPLLLSLVPLNVTALDGAGSEAHSKPNIVYFLIDDLGFADCGFNGGSDIRTPNIDKLAKDGAILKSFYVQPVCSPTRAPIEQTLQPDGLDIWPVLTQNAKSPHDAILLVGNKPGVAAIRMGDWKLLVSPSDKDAEEQTVAEANSERMELYNLLKDIAETKNLVDTEPGKVMDMRMRLDAMLENAVAPGDTVRNKKQNSKNQK